MIIIPSFVHNLNYLMVSQDLKLSKMLILMLFLYFKVDKPSNSYALSGVYIIKYNYISIVLYLLVIYIISHKYIVTKRKIRNIMNLIN